jgi:hypothetical protein
MRAGISSINQCIASDCMMVISGINWTLREACDGRHESLHSSVMTYVPVAFQGGLNYYPAGFGGQSRTAEDAGRRSFAHGSRETRASVRAEE